tara:strand:+ start:5520 stop:6947 length:1428 start_codon:yes stop_codon:yes gene_type:complete
MPEEIKDSTPSPELGYTGLKTSNGTITEEFLPELQGSKANQVYKQMKYNDPIVGAILFAVEMTIRGVDWSVKPADHPKGQEHADYLQTVMDDMEKPWTEVINDILSFLAYGFSVNELVYKKRLGPTMKDRRFKSDYSDGLWGWRKLPTRAQCTIKEWVFQGDRVKQGTGRSVTVTRGDRSNVNDLKGFVQTNPNTFTDKYIPRNKFMLFRTTSQLDNPQGHSLLRQAYRPWFFKTRLEEIEAIGIERDLAGLPMFWVPHQYLSPDATPEQRAAVESIKEIGTSIRKNQQGCIIFPNMYDELGNKLFDVELLGNSSGGGKNIATDTIIHRYGSQIAQSVLADFILMGQQSVGSFALSENKVKLFFAAIGSYLDSISSVFNKEAVPKLWELNGFSPDSMPKIKHGEIEKHSLSELSEYFGKILTDNGVQMDEELDNWLRERVDAPAKGDAPYSTPQEKINDKKIEAGIGIKEKTTDE